MIKFFKYNFGGNIQAEAASNMAGKPPTYSDLDDEERK